MSEDINDKLNNANDIVELVNTLLNDAKSSQVVYNKVDHEECVVDDIALIQCFYGNNVARIRATTTAIEFNLKMTDKPSTWVFVECQKSKDECVFGWLKKYGVKYHFVQMTDDNDGIFLKTPLWNIGASLCIESKLCFIDSDVVMCDSDWVSKANKAFNEYDVLSLASHQYYENDNKCKLYKTIGYKWVTSGVAKGGHCGFTIGMTRSAFNEMGGFDATLILDDIQTFHRICGSEVFKGFSDWIKVNELSSDERFGYDFRLGYVYTVACHIYHGDFNEKYDNIISLITTCNIRSYSTVISYDRLNPLELPRWLNTSMVIALRKTLIDYESHSNMMANDEKFDILEEFNKNIVNVCADSNNGNIIICTVVKRKFGNDITESDLIDFKEHIETMFAEKYGCNSMIVFFTDLRNLSYDSDVLNLIPLKDYDPDNEFAQCDRKDVKFPDKSGIIKIKFEKH